MLKQAAEMITQLAYHPTEAMLPVFLDVVEVRAAGGRQTPGAARAFQSEM